MLQAVYEVVVHFDSFRNVDLFHQGLYHIKARIHYVDEKNNGERRQLVPVSHHTSQSLIPQQSRKVMSKPSRSDHHCLVPPHIIEDTFATRSFLIRYCEEEVEMNDLVQFRLEVDANLKTLPDLHLEVDLMFADLQQGGAGNNDCEAPEATEFKSVSSQSFVIYNAHDAVHCFCPTVFDEYHFSLANMVIHTTLLDYRFRLCDAKHPGQNSAVSLSSALFADIPEYARALYCNELRSTATTRLAQATARLKEWYALICERCLTVEQRDLFGCDLDTTIAPKHSAQKLCIQMDKNGNAKIDANGTPENSPTSLASQLIRDINRTSAQTFAAWQRVLNVLPYCNREHTSLLRVEWEEKMIRRWGECLFSEELRPQDIMEGNDKSIEIKAQMAEKCRGNPQWRANLVQSSLPVEDEAMIPKVDVHPIIFEQTYTGTREVSGPPKPVFELKGAGPEHTEIPSAPKSYRGSHLFILVHGFQGNSFDMRLMKNNVAVLYPDAVFLCSNSNEDNTEGNIQDMGIRLAQEVVNYICDWCPGPTLGRLSFIAHSIGGLIVRAALPLLQEYSDKLFTYISFSSAHLGYMYNASTLVNTGIWVLKKWRKSKCLAQLSMTDAENPQDTFLYKLSQEPGLEWFENVVIVSSMQDQYSPFDSARIEMSQLALADPLADVYRAMVTHLWEKVKPEAITRFNVEFRIPERNLDAIIGRTAHIQFLESQPVMRMIIHTYPHFFR